MRGGRPRTKIGTYGEIHVKHNGKKHVASTRVRDHDGKLRRVTATAGSTSAATALLKERILERPVFGNTLIDATAAFDVLADLWLDDLDQRDLAEGTKERYRDTLRLHVRPFFTNFTLNEIATSRVEWFLKAEHRVSYSRAHAARTLLNLLFGYAMRQDAMTRNPVDGTSPLRRPKGTPQALTLDQIAAIRAAAAAWRTEPGLPGPRPDGQVRDILEVLLGTGMRPGEALALRVCDITDHPRTGMVAHISGTAVQRKGKSPQRQNRPKTASSVRSIAVPDFAAAVLRRRLKGLPPTSERTIFATRNGGVLSLHNVRRTFRDFLKLAGLEDSGITLRWYRRTVATVVARGMGTDAAATFLGHTSAVITEGHYIEPEDIVDRTPTIHLEATLRAESPDRTLLRTAPTDEEEMVMDDVDVVEEGIDDEPDADDVPAA